MRFTHVEIKNFRQYKNLTLDFPKKSDFDLHLIIADNGIGKTNILNAISWCLYDDEPHLGDSSKSLPRFNLRARKECEAEGKDEGKLSVSITIEDGTETITFIREASIRIATNFQQKSVFYAVINADGDAKRCTGEDATAYVEKFLMRKIRQYYFFDGEQLDHYFIGDESSEIRGSIHALSQAEVVSNIAARLDKIIKSKNIVASKEGADIKASNQAVETAENELAQQKRFKEDLIVQIKRSSEIIEDLSGRLAGQDQLPEIEADYQRLIAQRTDLLKRIEASKERLFSFVRRKKTALSLYPSAKNTLALISEKQAANMLPPQIDKAVLQQMLDEMSGCCAICGQDITADAKAHIISLLDKIQVSNGASHILTSIKYELESMIKEAETYPDDKDKILLEDKHLKIDLKECERQLEGIDEKLSKFKDKEQARDWNRQRAIHRDLLGENQKKLGVTERQIELTSDALEKARQALAKALEKNKRCNLLKKQIDFAQHGKQVMDSIEDEMMSEVRERIEQRTMEYFKNLIWKKDVYERVSLDSDYRLSLWHRDGYSCIGSCSAAERSLLALSFTLALHEASGTNPLLFIDTPVSRISGENRSNFATVLHDVAQEKQLILAFTRDEYSENVRRVFDPVASNLLRLSMNEYEDVTTINREEIL